MHGRDATRHVTLGRAFVKSIDGHEKVNGVTVEFP
jgi:hypothetical protein